jgi:hypothetical protein
MTFLSLFTSSRWLEASSLGLKDTNPSNSLTSLPSQER